MIEQLIEYLQKQPIAPILAESKEKDDTTALKLMCVVDHYTAKNDHYKKMANNPKLIKQLLKFNSYSHFKYYDCRVQSGLENYVLKCKFCELIGPYAVIMSHMATNHNAHVSHTICAFCSRKDLKEHLKTDTLNQCYREYQTKYDINENVLDEKVKIVDEFYALLKQLAKALDVTIFRNELFTGVGQRRLESIKHPIPAFPTTCTVFKQLNKNKPINETKLEHYFSLFISYRFGGNGLSRLCSPVDQDGMFANEKQTDDNDVHYISSDDEDDASHNGANNSNVVQVS